MERMADETLAIQRRLRNRRKHLPPLHLRRRLPPLRHLHVQRARHQLGRLAPGILRRRLHPHPRRLLPLRPQDPSQEQGGAQPGPEGRSGGGAVEKGGEDA